ncbi:MAG: S-layer homology domain-containing protein [Oscillospiraceae bacterium]|nr:S-layer homology domain-containing protein [Oscillospiraceae bacterium]
MKKSLCFCLAIILLVVSIVVPPSIYAASANSFSLDRYPEYPTTGQTYWIIFNEGYRNSRLEMTTFNIENTQMDPYIVWNRNLVLNVQSKSSRCNQYFLNDSGEWEQIGTYGIISDWATGVIASNLNVYDGNGNLIIPASEYIYQSSISPNTAIPSDAVIYNGHSYKVFDVGMTWDEAKTYCESIGGHLATVASQSEQDFISSQLSTGVKNSYWLGGFRTQGRDFTWVTGEQMLYTNWASGQPDNFTGRENCLMIYRVTNPLGGEQLKWNDLQDDGECKNEVFFGVSNFGFICEWDAGLSKSPELGSPDTNESSSDSATKVSISDRIYVVNLNDTELVVSGLISSSSFLPTRSNVKWFCSDQSAIFFTTEMMSFVDSTDGTHVSVPIWCRKAGHYTIELSADGMTATAGITIVNDGFTEGNVNIFWGSEGRNYNFHYSDNYFSQSSYIYNHDLARLSIGLEAASFTATGADTYTIEGTQDSRVGRDANIRDTHAKMGFTHSAYFNYEIPLSEASSKVAYSFAAKQINNKDTLIAVSIRGGGYGAEWADNFYVGDESFHVGFFLASRSVYNNLLAYISTLKTSGVIIGETKIWITGYSRAAAVANLTAMRLNANMDIDPNNLFAYTFATPRTVNKNKVAINNSDYNSLLGTNVNSDDNIHNIINPADFVPTLPLSKWGYERFGVSYTLPKYVYYISNTSKDMERLNEYLENTIKPVEKKYKEITGNDFPIKEPTNYSGVNKVENILKKLAKDTGQYEKKLQSIIVDFISVLTVNQDLVSSIPHDILNEYKLRFGDEAFGKMLVDIYEADDDFYQEVVETVVTMLLGGDEDYFKVFIAICNKNGMNATDILKEKLTIANIIKVIDLYITGLSDMGAQHNIEIYMAWLFAHDAASLFDSRTLNKYTIRCPVDVVVYDNKDNLVVSIVNDVIITDLLPVSVSGDAKELYIPSDGDYRMEITARDSGEMSFIVTEYDSESNETRKVNFYEIPLTPGLKLACYTTSGDSILNNRLSAALNSETWTIPADDILTGSDLSAIGITLDVSGYGSAFGNQNVSKGDYVTVEASALNGSSFSGWYRNGDKVSDAPVFSFVALESQILEARFHPNFNPFTDVAKSAWFYDYVLSAYNMGLINGRTATTYAPYGELSYAEAIKLAVCMYEIHTEGSVKTGNSSGSTWYLNYVLSALSYYIIDDRNYNWDAPATRAEYMEIFANALPDEALRAINTVTDGSIADVPMTHPQAAAIYKLYRAGILNGVDSDNNCSPASNIMRSEVAVVIIRMMDESTRIRFSM